MGPLHPAGIRIDALFLQFLELFQADLFQF
jgi:hypothetical protein